MRSDNNQITPLGMIRHVHRWDENLDDDDAVSNSMVSDHASRALIAEVAEGASDRIEPIPYSKADRLGFGGDLDDWPEVEVETDLPLSRFDWREQLDAETY